MKIGKQITPYLNFRRITTEEGLKEYQDSIANDEYTVYGEPNFTPNPNDKNDALLVVFDRDTGAVRKTKYDYYITHEGQIYKTLKNGNKGKLSEGLYFGVTFDDDTTLKYAVYHLVLWSYYTNLNWKPFCLATDSTVDHIKGDRELCHFKYLEAVTGSENSTRSKLTPKAEERKLNSAKSRGKAFNIFVNGEKLDGEFYSTRDGASHLKKIYKVSISSSNIANCLRDETYIKIKGNIITFDYTDEYKQSQEDLEGEIWFNEKDWKQKEKLKKIGFKGKAISNMGRILGYDKQKVYGSQVEGKLCSVFGGNQVHILVWLAFSDESITNEILHNNYHISNEFDENGVLIRYSNAFDSLRLGTKQDNMNDKSRDMQTAAEMIPENKFTVRDPSGNFVMTSSYVPECVEQLNILYKDNITFYSGCIRKCLKGDQPHHQNFTFKKE
jgi:hypothetical protein